MKYTHKLFLACLLMLKTYTSSSQVTVAFSADDTIVCPGAPVNFNSLSSIPAGYTPSYLWDFPGGFASSLITSNPTVYYYTPGIYTVSLTVSDPLLGSFSLTKTGYIQVVNPSDANFSFSYPDICNQLTVTFTNESIAGDAPVTSYLWDFDDGTFSTLENPTKTFTAAGVYNVILFITDGNGCSDNYSFPVSATAPISSSISVIGAISSCGTDVSPTISASTSGGVLPYSYSWDYGNGTTSTLASSIVNYSGCDKYDISYTVTDANGCSLTQTYIDYISIACPVADFSMSSDTICQNETVSFTNLSDLGATHYWQFSYPAAAPVSTLSDPTNTFTVAGMKLIKLTETYPDGCIATHLDTMIINPKPVITGISALDSTSCDAPFTTSFTALGVDSGTYTYLWDFEGITSTEVSPTITFPEVTNYDASVTITNEAGCSATFTINSFIKIKKPTGSISADIVEGCVPLTVTFTNASSSLYDSLAYFVWDYDDGTSDTVYTLDDITHVFDSTGNFHVEMTLYTEDGCLLTKSITILVGDKVAYYILDEGDPACNPIEIDNQSYGSDFTTVDWGDGVVSTLSPPIDDTLHFYTVLDTTTFVIDMMCEDNGCISHYIDSVEVLPILSPILQTWDCSLPSTVTISIDTSIVQGDFCIGFTGLDTICDTNPIIYDFGPPGTYEMNIITNEDSVVAGDCPPVLTFYIIVPEVIPSFSFSPSPICDSGLVSFESTTYVMNDYIINYTWDIGPGLASGISESFSSLSPSYAYNFATQDVYPVSLTVTDINGCEFSIIDTIVIGNPIAAFVVDSIIGCSPKTVYFSNSSSVLGSGVSIISNIWNFDGAAADYSGITPPPINFPNGVFEVELTVLDNFGCSNSYTDTFDFSNVIAATYISDSLSCNDTDPLFFENTSMGDYSSILWDYGDGTLDSTLDGSHFYATEGFYTVTLTLNDTIGCTSVYEDSFNVEFDDLEAQFDLVYLTSATCPPVPLQLINSSTGDILSYEWEVERETGIFNYYIDTLLFTYTEPGDYDISISAISSHGCVDTMSILNAVHIPGPTGEMTFYPNSGCLPLDVTFTISDLNADLAYIDFGDGDTILITGDYTHTYIDEGTFCPSLILLDSTGCLYEVNCVGTLTTYPSPSAALTLSDSSICLGESTTFYNSSFSPLSDPIDTFILDLGDGTISTYTTFDSIVHTYLSSGSYDISFITSNTYCIDTAYITADVNTFPSAIFDYSPTEGCNEVTVDFTLSGVDADDILIDFGDGVAANITGDTTYTYSVAGEYLPMITLNSVSGCDQPIMGTDTIKVISTVQAIFSLSDSSICLGEAITIFNEDTATYASPVEYLFDFGDGTIISSSSFDSIDHSYSTAGSFIIELKTITDICSDSSQLPLNINSIPTAAIFYTPIVGCSPLMVEYEFSGSTADSIMIDFGDGTIQTTIDSVIHEYLISGSYLPTFIFFSNNGCSQTVNGDDSISVLDIPQSVFTLSDSSVCEGESVTIYNIDTTDYTMPVTYIVDFGDGTIETVSFFDSLDHTYLSSGAINISLKIDNGYCSDSSFAELIVNDLPNATLDYTILEGCVPLTVDFYFTGLSADTILFDPGSGIPVSISGDYSYTYDSAGIYTPFIHLTNISGCNQLESGNDTIQIYEQPQSLFTLKDSSICEGEAIMLYNLDSTDIFSPEISYEIDFGDGTIFTLLSFDSTEHNYAAPGSYLIKVLADNGFCSDSSFATAVVNDIPSATIDYTPLAGCHALNVDFTFTGLSADTITLYFGDGNSEIISGDLSYVYEDQGNYLPYITLNNNSSCNQTLFADDSIHVYDPPIADISLNDTLLCDGEELIVYNNSIYTASSPITFYSINFGDGTSDYIISSFDSVSHTFSSSGIFNVQLLVENIGGCFDSIIKTVEVAPIPSATMDISPIIGCGTLASEFIFSSISADSLILFTGDSTVEVLGSSYTYLFEAPGIYYPMLTAKDANGCMQTITSVDSIIVSYTPSAQMVLSDSMPYCTGQEVYVINFSVDTIDNPFINPIDMVEVTLNGTTIYSSSWLDSLSYTFSTAGDYNIQLITTNDLGCSDTTATFFSVYETPVALAGYDTTICPGITINLDGTSSSGGTNYLWSPAYAITDPTSANPSGTFTETTLVYLQYSNDYCTAFDSVLINVLEEMELEVGPDTAICYGNSVQLYSLYDAEGGEVQFIWLQGDYLSSTLIDNPVSTPENTITYTVSAACGDLIVFDDVHIEVNPLPIVNIEDTTTMILNEPIMLNALAEGSGTLDYTWFPDEYLSCYKCASTEANPDSDISYWVTVMDENKCSATDSIYLKVEWECAGEGIEVANIISPNNDGFNDMFQFRTEAIKELEYFRIYNRWGQLMFQSSDVNNSWDGTFKGKLCDAGVYVYSIKGVCFDDEEFVKSGNVTLLH